MAMLDDIDRLRNNPHLVELLSHYANLAKGDRAIWQNRLMHLEGVESKELSKLHGELIVFDWIEQNTGQAADFKDGVIAACYRATLNGLRDLCRLQGIEFDDKVFAPAPEPKGPRGPRKKKQKSDATEILELAASE
jgi:hypothetical protein